MESLDPSSDEQFQDRLKWNKNSTYLSSVCDTVSRRIRDKYGRAREAEETVGDLNMTFFVI